MRTLLVIVVGWLLSVVFSVAPAGGQVPIKSLDSTGAQLRLRFCWEIRADSAVAGADACPVFVKRVNPDSQRIKWGYGSFVGRITVTPGTRTQSWWAPAAAGRGFWTCAEAFKAGVQTDTVCTSGPKRPAAVSLEPVYYVFPRDTVRIAGTASACPPLWAGLSVLDSITGMLTTPCAVRDAAGTWKPMTLQLCMVAEDTSRGRTGPVRWAAQSRERCAAFADAMALRYGARWQPTLQPDTAAVFELLGARSVAP